MKKAFLSALIVVAIYLIINVSLYIWVNKDPSASEGGGVGWYYILFLLWGTPIFLAIAVRVFFINYDLHRNPNSALALKSALKSALVVVAIYLIILVSLYIGVNIDPSEGGLGWLFGLFLIGGTPIFLVLAVIVFLIGLKEDKKKGNSTPSNLLNKLLSFIQSLIGW